MPVSFVKWTLNPYHHSKENGNIVAIRLKCVTTASLFNVRRCLHETVSDGCKTSATSCTQWVAVVPAMLTNNGPDGSHCLFCICCTTTGQWHYSKSEFARPAGGFQNCPNMDMHVTCHKPIGLTGGPMFFGGASVVKFQPRSFKSIFPTFKKGKSTMSAV